MAKGKKRPADDLQKPARAFAQFRKMLGFSEMECSHATDLMMIHMLLDEALTS